MKFNSIEICFDVDLNCSPFGVWPLRIQLKIGSLKLNNKRFLLKRRADEDVNVLLSDGAIFFYEPFTSA